MPPCDKPQAPRAVSHVAREAATNRKSTMFLRAVGLRAVGVGGERSTTESERNAPNARVRTMRTSPTTDVSRVRAWARACTADGTHLGLRPNQPFGLAHHARLTTECAQSRTRSASRSTSPCSRQAARPPSLCAAMCYVPARPAAVRQHRRIARSSATRTSCRGCVGVGRRARSVQCCVRVVAWRAG